MDHCSCFNKKVNKHDFLLTIITKTSWQFSVEIVMFVFYELCTTKTRETNHSKRIVVFYNVPRVNAKILSINRKRLSSVIFITLLQIPTICLFSL